MLISSATSYHFQARWQGPTLRAGAYTIHALATETIRRAEIIENPAKDIRSYVASEASVEVQIR